MADKKTTKNEIVDAIYSESGHERKVIYDVVDRFLNELKDNLEEGSVIELRGFGTFELRLRKGKESAHNPKTGEAVTVKPHYVVAFRAGKELKENVWNLEISDEK